MHLCLLSLAVTTHLFWPHPLSALQHVFDPPGASDAQDCFPEKRSGSDGARSWCTGVAAGVASPLLPITISPSSMAQ